MTTTPAAKRASVPHITLNGTPSLNTPPWRIRPVANSTGPSLTLLRRLDKPTHALCDHDVAKEVGDRLKTVSTARHPVSCTSAGYILDEVIIDVNTGHPVFAARNKGHRVVVGQENVLILRAVALTPPTFLLNCTFPCLCRFSGRLYIFTDTCRFFVSCQPPPIDLNNQNCVTVMYDFE